MKEDCMSKIKAFTDIVGSADQIEKMGLFYIL